MDDQYSKAKQFLNDKESQSGTFIFSNFEILYKVQASFLKFHFFTNKFNVLQMNFGPCE